MITNAIKLFKRNDAIKFLKVDGRDCSRVKAGLWYQIDEVEDEHYTGSCPIRIKELDDWTTINKYTEFEAFSLQTCHRSDKELRILVTLIHLNITKPSYKHEYHERQGCVWSSGDGCGYSSTGLYDINDWGEMGKLMDKYPECLFDVNNQTVEATIFELDVSICRGFAEMFVAMNCQHINNKALD